MAYLGQALCSLVRRTEGLVHLRDAGRHFMEEATGRRALALSPDSGMMQVFLGSLEADAGLNDAARSRREQALGAKLDPREAFRARKELARVLDKLGAYDEVFPHLHASARIGQSIASRISDSSRA